MTDEEKFLFDKGVDPALYALALQAELGKLGQVPIWIAVTGGGVYYGEIISRRRWYEEVEERTFTVMPDGTRAYPFSESGTSKRVEPKMPTSLCLLNPKLVLHTRPPLDLSRVAIFQLTQIVGWGTCEPGGAEKNHG